VNRSHSDLDKKKDKKEVPAKGVSMYRMAKLLSLMSTGFLEFMRQTGVELFESTNPV
jgi:hypothetical protein